MASASGPDDVHVERLERRQPVGDADGVAVRLLGDDEQPPVAGVQEPVEPLEHVVELAPG